MTHDQRPGRLLALSSLILVNWIVPAKARSEQCSVCVQTSAGYGCEDTNIYPTHCSAPSPDRCTIVSGCSL